MGLARSGRGGRRRRSRRSSSVASWASRKAVSEHLASMTNSAAARQPHGHVGPAAALLGVGRGLFVEVEAVAEAGGLQHVAQGLLAPAALHAGPAAQGGGQLAGLVLGGGRGAASGAIWALQARRLLGRGSSRPADLLLELGQSSRPRLRAGLPGRGLGQQARGLSEVSRRARSVAPRRPRWPTGRPGRAAPRSGSRLLLHEAAAGLGVGGASGRSQAAGLGVAGPLRSISAQASAPAATSAPGGDGDQDRRSCSVL